MISRLPMPCLRPFVQRVWATEWSVGTPGAAERVLPTGATHLVFRLGEQPLRVFDDTRDTSGHTFADALVGGARAQSYVKEMAGGSCSVGAMLQPGAAAWLFGVPADDLAGRHTELSDLWGARAHAMHRRIFDARTAEARLAVLEAFLAAQLPRLRALHPAVALALHRFELGAPSVRQLVRASGYSHRHFIALFRHEVGLAPKAWCRVQRLQRALALAAACGHVAWAELALRAGYSDQAHLNRDFHALAGITPQAYRRSAPAAPNHVPIPVPRAPARAGTVVNSVQDAARFAA